MAIKSMGRVTKLDKNKNAKLAKVLLNANTPKKPTSGNLLYTDLKKHIPVA